ncbi:MAG TPA: hypothetical protein VFP65_13540 [Anaeromyxobacteraceae bacterium]|nr:hypothetical protein [Anaeromyxobacteraceae bacterium]
MGALEARRIGYLGRTAVALANAEVRAVVDAEGGMMPEFGLRRGKGLVNAHWLPDFRGDLGTPWSDERCARYWKARLLYLIAGDFPCSPSFGPGCTVDGVALPPHGWAANETWALEAAGVDSEAGAAWARFALDSPAAAMPISYRKHDLVLEGQPAYFSVMRVRNAGAAPVAIQLGRHNTVGPPFLQAGCAISACADRFQVPPPPTEFDGTGCLVQGAEFESLAAAPLRSGGTIDLRTVPGPAGWTDLVAGAVPAAARLGWSCVVNPVLGLAYVCFFPGPAGLPRGEIALGFNVLWLQYGGRDFAPWAHHEGGPDRTFCLGTENTVSGFANGLAWARAHPTVLGVPTTVEIPAGGERTLVYGTALVRLDPALLSEGVRGVEAEPGAMILRGARSAQRVPVAADLEAVRRAVARLG